MLQENELDFWLEEDLIVVERFQKASNLLLNFLENWKVFEIRDVRCTRTTIPIVSRRAACY